MLAWFARNPSDSKDTRSAKSAIFIVASLCTVAGVVWSLMYLAILGWGIPSAVTLAFSVVVGGSLVLSHLRRNHLYAVYVEIFAIIALTAILQWSIGGISDSGFVLVWATLGPVIALMFFPVRFAVPWMVLLLVCVAITAAFDPWFSTHGYDVPPEAIRLFFAMNLGVSSSIVFVFAGFFVMAERAQRERANRLLINVLPEEIAEILQEQGDGATIADRYDSVSVLFADIVGSTPMFSELDPHYVVDWLNEIFSVLDDVVERHGLEKIKTIGDAYMVAAGIPDRREDHAEAMVACALEMVDAVDAIPPRHDRRIRFRFGIHSGPVVAGVIGKSRFHFDLWGDVVNVAARMESHGEAGRIQISDDTHDLVEDRFQFEPRRTISIKGKGTMSTWFVTSPAEAAKK
jgi:adenylate cyclase